MLEINKVHCWDCLELMKQIPDKSVDLVLTDPPYGINMDKGSETFGSTAVRQYDDERDGSIPTAEYFAEILRIGKSVIIFWGNFFTEFLPTGTHWIVRDKQWEMKFKNPFSKCELAWTNLKKNTINKYVVIQQWFIAEEKERYHPTQKPVQLFKSIIEDYSKEWDLILDPFLWSWTTAVACKELGRNFIGIEKEQKYVDIANKRLSQTSVSLF